MMFDGSIPTDIHHSDDIFIRGAAHRRVRRSLIVYVYISFVHSSSYWGIRGLGRYLMCTLNLSRDLRFWKIPHFLHEHR